MRQVAKCECARWPNSLRPNKEKYAFDVGGKNKGFEQIKDLANSFVVSDNIEIGFGNKIPLWIFGFLY